MSQIGVFIPCHGAEGAACVKQSIEAAHCYTGLRVVKLRTGPSVTARLDALEADILDHRTRLGDLESDSGGMARAREIEALKDAAFGPVAPVRPEPGSVEPTDDDLGRIARAQANSLGYAAAGRALYNLGREHGRADADAAIDMLRGDRGERAEKAERQLSRWVQEACDVGEALKPYRAPLTAAFLSRAGDIRDLVGDWQKRGEELEALKGQRAEDMRRGVRIGMQNAGDWTSANAALEAATAALSPRPSTPTPIVRVPVESAGADGARLSEAEMAAELRAEGWVMGDVTNYWYRDQGDIRKGLWFTFADAHAAMRAAKGAK